MRRLGSRLEGDERQRGQLGRAAFIDVVEKESRACGEQPFLGHRPTDV